MDGPPPQEEDFTSIPVSERLAHKNWKARVSAYESLSKTFANTASDTDPAFKPYVNNVELLKRIATDSNAVAQEKGVECLVALVKFAGETAARTREGVVPALVDKCLGSTRAGTRNQAVELILQYVEIENGGAGVVTDVLVGLGAKQPKAVAGCILALKEAMRVFGVQVVPSPPILKVLPKIFAHSDKTVRAEGTSLSVVIYQYIGPGIEPWLADLKPVQVKELKDSFDALDKDGKGHKSLRPERLTRAHAREAALHGEDDDAPQEEEEDEAPLDPRAFAEAVDIVPKLSPSLQTNLKSSKWKERKEALDDLATLLTNTSRIKDANELAELARSLASCIAKDANINCVMVAANCVEELAKGLMDSFARHREAVVPLMLERMKERKANVTDAIGAALDAVFATTNLASIIPDMDVALKSKNPQVKEGTLKFLGRCLGSATAPIPPAQVKPLAETLAVLLEDGFEGARNEAATCFGCLMKMVGERLLNATMDTLPDMRKAKVKEAFEKAVVKCKAGVPPAPKAVAPPPPAKKGSKKAPPPEEAPPPVKKAVAAKPTAKPATKKVAVAAPPAATVGKKPAGTAKAGGSGTTVNLDAVKYKHTPEDAEALADELIPSSIMTDLGDANWKTRLACLDDMSAWLEPEIESVDAEVLIRALAKKGWGEKNFQVSAKIYGIFGLLALECSSFGRSCVALCVPHLTEKLGDMKLKKPAGDTLLAFAEKTSLQFVLGQAYAPLSAQKAPKVLADAITWMNTALGDFGLKGVALRSLIDFLKTALQNSNAAVRTSATKTLVTVKLFAGSSIKDLLEDLNPQLLNTITSEFDKVEGQDAPEPCRTSADLASVGTESSNEAKVTGGDGDPLDDLFPRVDIETLLKGTTILTDAKSDAWKTKKEALENLQAILDQGSNKRLKSSMGEIGQILKARVTDTNKAVQTLALDIVSRIATGMGKPFEKHARLFVQPICTVFADQKASIRASALLSLTAIAVACDGVESMVPGFTTALEATNPLQKATILQWMVEWFKEQNAPSSLDLHPWAAIVVSSLDDRNSDVRKGAQALLPTVIQCAGFDFVMQQSNSLKPASRASAVPLIQAARPPPPEHIPKASAGGKGLSTVDVRAASPPDNPTTAAEAKPTTKALGVRRKLPPGTVSRPDSRAETPDGASKVVSNGIKKSAAGSAAATRQQAATPAAQNSSLPFLNINADVKKARLAKDANRWVNEGGPTRKDLAELLQSQMEPNANKELVARLFSRDHNAVNDYINGMGIMADFYSEASGADDNVEKLCIANLDLPLKYISIKAHEPQPNLISKCMDVVEAVLAFLRNANYQLTDNEAMCFVPTMVFKLGDAREQVRSRVQQVIRNLPTVYAYSRVFQLLLDHGLKAKVAKTRQGALDEMSAILKKSGMGACEPSKAFPSIASMLSDKDPQVRKSALGTLSEAYSLVGEKVWSLVGSLSPKDKTQLEERLRRVPGPAAQTKIEPPAIVSGGVARLTANVPRPASPSVAAVSRLARPASPANFPRSASPAPIQLRSESPVRPLATNPATSSAVPSSPGKGRPRSMLPSRLGRPRPNFAQPAHTVNIPEEPSHYHPVQEAVSSIPSSSRRNRPVENDDLMNQPEPVSRPDGPDDITLTISSILSSDPARSVDALKKIQKILSVGPDNGPASPQYRELAEHTEGLVETITLQMAHVFEHPDDLISDDNFRLAKHLIQTLNNFCDHAFLAESLTVDILTALLEELTLRLLETDDSPVKKVKDLSRFINMIILRLFATGRRMSIFRSLFALLLQIVKPFPSNGVLPDSKESKVAELVLKCVWKLARNIPQDLGESLLDPVELFPAIEHFLQSVPPNEWRARATNKVPCGDMPLRTIKVIIQHIVAHYGDDVYELLSASFDDPSATIVYPYVYRILNSGSRATEAMPRRNGNAAMEHAVRPISQGSNRPLSPQGTASSAQSVHHPPSHRTSPSESSAQGNGQYSPNVEEPDPDAQLLVIIGHISSETTGALHKEGITELHHFLKAYPHKKARVEKVLESTGAAFRKYINRALASRAAEDQERNVAVADTLSKLEYNNHEAVANIPSSSDPTTGPKSPSRGAPEEGTDHQQKLSRLHDIFQYRSSTLSSGSSQGRTTPSGLRTSLG
ncbi:microtubule associated protein [Crassisporium funariophilum]|nr:microtubule associated protein [Crassisporium funariophilum]